MHPATPQSTATRKSTVASSDFPQFAAPVCNEVDDARFAQSTAGEAPVQGVPNDPRIAHKKLSFFAGGTAPATRAIKHLQDDDTTSEGGERPKLTLQHHGRLWLAKSQDRGDAPHLSAQEFAVMQMAAGLGLQVPEVRFEKHAGREAF